MLTKEYFEKIREARAIVDEIYEQEDKMVELIEETDVVVDPVEIELTAEQYVKQLLAEGCGTAGTEESMDTGPRQKMREREVLHGTADTVISLPNMDGMTAEFLLHQPVPAVAEYLEQITEEVY